MPNTLLLSDTKSPSFEWSLTCRHLSKAICNFKYLYHLRSHIIKLAQITSRTLLPHSAQDTAILAM